jgi:acyl carrier protein/RimJ/RimL family protein N-acetyltransferase
MVDIPSTYASQSTNPYAPHAQPAPAQAGEPVAVMSSSGMPPAPRLRGRVAELLPIGLVPVSSLYEIAMAGAAATWRTRGRTVPIEEFASYLSDGSGASFAVGDPNRTQVVGFIGIFGHDVASRTASLSTFVDQRLDRAPLLAADALELFCRYCFEVIGLRKLVVEMPTPIAAGLRAAAQRLECLTLEGVLRAHARFGQELCDVEIYAVWATEFLARVAPPVEPPATSFAEEGAFGLVAAAIARVTDGDVVPAGLSGGHRLIDDLHLDSLALAELFDELERRCGHELPLEALDASVCVQDLVTLVEYSELAARPDHDLPGLPDLPDLLGLPDLPGRPDLPGDAAGDLP